MSSTINCVILGDRKSEKSALLGVYLSMLHEQPFQNEPGIIDDVTVKISYEGSQTSLRLWDTSGQEDYDKLRTAVYSIADVFILAFSVISPETLHDISAKWLPEAKHFRPNAPMILVATDMEKRDMQDVVKICEEKYNRGCISNEEGLKIAKDIKAYRYHECSWTLGNGVKELFDEVIEAFMSESHHSKGKDSHYFGHKLLCQKGGVTVRDEKKKNHKKDQSEEKEKNKKIEKKRKIGIGIGWKIK